MRYFLPLLVALLSFNTISLQAQSDDPAPPPLIHSLDSIRKGIDAYDRGNYDSAITLFNHVEFNDSNYALAQYELSLALTAKEDHEGSLKAGLLALQNSDSTDPGYFTSAGNSYDELGQPEKALELYNNGLKLFPYSYLIYFNRAVVYSGQKEYDKALADLKRAVEINPFHASSHLNLANIALNEEQYAQALLSVGYFLMLEPNSGRSNAVLTYINKAVSDRPDLEKKNIKISESPEDFQKINLLIKSYAALRDDYKVDSDIEVPLIKQMDLAIKQSAQIKKSNDFWVNYYGPFYKQMTDEDRFEYFSYLISASSASSRHQKIIEKNIQDILDFIKWYQVELKVLHGTHHEGYNQDNPQVGYWFFEDANRLEAIGSASANGVKNGDFTFLYSEGAVSSVGSMKDDERDGDWTFYYSNGDPVFVCRFENGELNGPAKAYFSNGRLEKDLSYKDGYYNGVTAIYDKNGYMDRTMFHVDGKIEDSLVYFFSNGKRSAYLPMKESNIEGQASYFLSNGDLSAEVMFSEDMKNGSSISYFQNKEISVKSNYVDGLLQGPYVSYYTNGQVESQGSYEKGIKIGKWESFHYDGTRASTAEYDESGKQNGHQEYFNQNGKLSVSYEYVRGEIKEYQHFDNDGNPIHGDVRKKGKFWYEDYTTYGVKISEGNYFGDHKEGEWKYYTNNGILSSVEHFDEEGHLNGECLYYYDNGEPSSKMTYMKDTLQGLYRRYFIHGIMREQGNYLNGKLHGEWLTYYPDGTLKLRYYYQGGKQHGRQYDYDPAGTISTVSYYRNGELYQATDVSADSSFIRTEKFNVATDTVRSYYPNQQLVFAIPYLGGQLNGVARWYYANGQLETEGEFSIGDRHGEWRYYYPDGTLRETRNYFLGIPVGEWNDYHPTGKIASSTFYENGERHGESVFYYLNGNVDTRSTYNQGEYNGKRYFHDINGNVGHIRYYDHGRIIGYSYLDQSGEEKPMIPIVNETAEVTSYFQNGKISREYKLVNGLLVGDYTCYNSDGQQREEMHFVNGDYDGDRIDYYADGKVWRKQHYENGVLHGDFAYYFPNGKIQRKGVFVNDLLHGEMEIYNEQGKLLHHYLYREGDLYQILND